jgi:predicted O-methyltransferase YrrM
MQYFYIGQRLADTPGFVEGTPARWIRNKAMRIREKLRKLVPLSISVYARTRAESKHLKKLGKMPIDTSKLSIKIGPRELQKIFSSADSDEEWPDVEREVSSLNLGKVGGLNFGDRRALYYLVRHFRPQSVLEVGTHVGASTVNALAALRHCSSQDHNDSRKLTTVDIRDVNDARSRPWKTFGSKYSPKEMSEIMGVPDLVEFIATPSIHYLSTCTDGFDFIFLDGNHAATTVYQEVPLALSVLNKDGVILLHDFFPNLKPLWSYKNVIPGPWLAIQRMQQEGANFQVLPIGELPWMTKHNSKVSSLALLVGDR